MKVLHILNELNPSGAEVMLKVAAPYWQKLGLHSEILSTGQQVGIYAPALSGAGYKIHHLPFAKTPKPLMALRSFLLKNRYDILHLHSEYTCFWCTLVARTVKVPRIIRTVHNTFNPRFHPLTMFRRKVMDLLGILQVSISSAVQDNELRSFYNATTLIPNWYDSDRFIPVDQEQRLLRRKELNIKKNVFVLVSVGNCNRVKNHQMILHAIDQSSPDVDVLYLHVGLEDRLNSERKIARALGISKYIRFVGFVEDVLPYLQAADTFIMPSLYEGLPISAIEAMGAGLPVILSDVPGLNVFRNICDDIFWVKPELKDITEKLSGLIQMSAENRQKIGKKLSVCAREHFSLNKGAQEYANLYFFGKKACC